MLFSQLLFAQPRAAAVAGSFYSSDKTELASQVESFLQNAQSVKKESIQALIVPHAGYVFSGDIAAKAYATLGKKYKNIFLLGTSHYASFEGASIYTLGNYQTPLGEVKVNQKIVAELVKKSKLFSFHAEAHKKEHSIEVQLPFLQTLYADDLNIIPILLGTNEIQTIKEIATHLQPYFTEQNLFVISSDLSHFPSHADANILDKKTLQLIQNSDAKEFIELLFEHQNSKQKEPQTLACGWSSILTLLYLSEDKNYNYELLAYKNSGDTVYGDKERVVGYGALEIKSEAFFLSLAEKEELLEIAKLALYEATLNERKISLDEKKISPKLREPLGAFVTLYKNQNLRGCIGVFEPHAPLYQVIINMAIASAQNDPRFEKVKVQELSDINLEISVLTPRKKINSLQEIVVGQHGIYLQKGSKNGTYLPHVATQMAWGREEFVKSCALDKANMTLEEYKDAEIFIYEALIF